MTVFVVSLTVEGKTSVEAVRTTKELAQKEEARLKQQYDGGEGDWW